MSIGRLFVHPVVFTEPTMVVNRYSEPAPDWSVPAAATHNEYGWFSRTSTVEMAEGREAITDTYELSLPATSVLDETMRVAHAGAVYEVRGSLQHAGTPAGPHHVVAELRRVQG